MFSVLQLTRINHSEFHFVLSTAKFVLAMIPRDLRPCPLTNNNGSPAGVNRQAPYTDYTEYTFIACPNNDVFTFPKIMTVPPLTQNPRSTDRLELSQGVKGR